MLNPRLKSSSVKLWSTPAAMKVWELVKSSVCARAGGAAAEG